MIKLKRAVWRQTAHVLDGSFGRDRGKTLVVGLLPAQGENVPDQLALRPLRSRGRTEFVSLADVYRFAVRCKANRAALERARMIKERKSLRLAAARQARAERRLVERPT